MKSGLEKLPPYREALRVLLQNSAAEVGVVA